MSEGETEQDAGIDLGTAAEVLFEDGKTQAAALLIDADLRLEYVDTGFRVGDSENPVVLVNGALYVPRFLIDRFSEPILSDIQDALNEVYDGGTNVMNLTVRSKITPAGTDWRERLQERMTPRATNQASVGPKMAAPIMEDGCQFRSAEELRVYHALKRARRLCKPDDGFAIAPNAALVVADLRTTEPDFLVMFRGRVGIIQVDGPSHHGRFGAEATRERHYKRNGIALVEHVLVEETNSDADLDRIVTGFLRLLIR